ncbi:MAG TPA: DUF4136 domain-containing protein [Burkholderiales bacterium]|nr:DUF4136 domain-containing protein [Burkholderiales bacterium]
MRTILRSAAALAAIILVIVTIGGCAGTRGTTTTYSYDPRFSFPASNTYQWAEAQPTNRRDSLLEANVQFLADRELQAKGLTARAENPALLVWMSYESSTNIYSDRHGHEVQALTLNVARANGRELVWRGLATGAIRTDAASGDLQKAVAGILSHFPPK